eukprot:TRINITY_DN8425_c0_g1_i6.p1 TRINITY_DN8425_c0_g1~~TRINITY_DN8425_c0_g1_i6.p1  ORF type:complete len:904 (+),score=153.16 TRINITY_DN8425_c0_g1_i6:140-2851(+)
MLSASSTLMGSSTKHAAASLSLAVSREGIKSVDGEATDSSDEATDSSDEASSGSNSDYCSSSNTNDVGHSIVRKRFGDCACGRYIWCLLGFVFLVVCLGCLAIWGWTSGLFSTIVLPDGYCQSVEKSLPLIAAVDGSATATVAGRMAVADLWAKLLVANLTFGEKQRLVEGIGYLPRSLLPSPGYYVGNTLAIPRLGVPSLKMQDAAQGFRTLDANSVGKVTSWPCSLAMSSSWDPEAVERWAIALGTEFKAKGANVVLGPAVEVHRVPFGGRNAELLSGEDPALGSPLAAAYVRGIQDRVGIVAVAKHWVLNQQEMDRSNVNSIATAQTLWEQYYPPFQAAVDAGVAAVMCSYNNVNGKQACAQSETIQRDLKERMGFRGWVMTDWWARHRGDRGPSQGLDQVMPGPDPAFMVEASVDQSRFDDMVTRILRGMVAVGVLGPGSRESCRIGCDCDWFLNDAVATSVKHAALARELAAESTVLLQNLADDSNGVGPSPSLAGLSFANATRACFLAASNAGRKDATSDTSPSRHVLPLRPSQTVAVLGSACDAQPNIKQLLSKWDEGSYYTVGGSGRVLASRFVSVLDGLRAAQAEVPPLLMGIRASSTDDISAAFDAMKGSDVAVVCGASTTSEGRDRSTLRLDQDDFISALLQQNPAQTLGVPVVVLVIVPGAVVTSWRHNASAVLAMFLSGQETGHAAADVLLGRKIPSGKLPVTFPADEADALESCSSSACPYSEGIWGGWHVYDGKPVAYPFGHGITYTSFLYEVSRDWQATANLESFFMTVRLLNSGARSGREVLQLYVAFPGDVTQLGRLRNYSKTPMLAPCEQKEVRVGLNRRDLSVWDSRASSWKPVWGRFRLALGTSSRDVVFGGSFELQERPESGSSPGLFRIVDGMAPRSLQQ